MFLIVDIHINEPFYTPTIDLLYLCWVTTLASFQQLDWVNNYNRIVL